MSARDQVFSGTVNGDIAGRDVVNNIHVLPVRPESELQAVFKQHTGIHCSREVRIRLERLMEVHGFTSQELARAWNVNSLIWDQQTRRLRSTSGKVDMVAGWAGVIAATAMLIFGLVEIFLDSSHTYKSALLLIAVVAYVLGARFILLSTIFPQMTARRAEKIGASEEMNELPTGST